MIGIWGGLFPAPIHASSMLSTGIQYYEQGDWQSALDSLQSTLPSGQRSPLKPHQAQALRYIAQAQWQLGQTSDAVNSLTGLANHYRRTENLHQLGRVLTQQAQYFIELGNFNQARHQLCHSSLATFQSCRADSAIQLAIASGDRPGQIAALGSLGILLSKSGELDLGQQTLQAALTLSQKQSNAFYQHQLLNGLGQNYLRRAAREKNYAQLSHRSNDQRQAQLFQSRSQAALNQAIARFEQAYQDFAEHPISPTYLETATHLIQAYFANGQTTQALRLLSQSQAWLDQLPLSQAKLQAAARIVQLQLAPSSLTVGTIASMDCPTALGGQPAQGQILGITQWARQLQNREMEAHSFGLLGQLAQCQQRFEEARRYTEQAILFSQRLENRYRWEWQLGKIFQSQNQLPNAIRAYEQAVDTLDQVRADVVAANRDFQLDLQANVERLYRDLSYLQLWQVNRLSENDSRPFKRKALENLDRLRLVEIQNYLAEDCELPEVSATVANIDQKTAVVRTIIFPDRMAVALTYRDRNHQSQTQLHWVHQSQGHINEIINRFRYDLEKRSDLTRKYLRGSQTIYDWLIRPFAAELSSQQVDTLIFIQDGLLRSIPMASLHDGQSFLVESYAIANATHWLPAKPQESFDSDRILAFGLTESAQIFQFSQPLTLSPLPGVRQELTAIQTQFKDSQIRLNQAFSAEELQRDFTQQSPQIVHLATHARFGIDPRETYLITGKKQNSNGINEKIRMPEFYQLVRALQSPMKLLALTGCETAAGNERDALGMTGIALQAGVETVIASLWQLDDQATGDIVPYFYRGLTQGESKAQALRQAQLFWLKSQENGRFGHPGYWASLILVGDWR